MELVYQPVVDLRTGRVAKVEALLRLVGSLQAISEFVTFCESSGRIKKLTADVLDIGLADWRQHGRPGVALSVNVSIANLDEPDLARGVLKALRQHHFDPTNLWFELAERAQEMTEPKRIACLRSVASAGIRFAIDGFFDVTQFTVLDLERLPWSELKIHPDLVTGAVENMTKRQTLKAAISVARQLGIDVTAKGVESAEVAELMMRLGCSHGQGHYFAEPASASNIGGMLDSMPSAAYLEQHA